VAWGHLTIIALSGAWLACTGSLSVSAAETGREAAPQITYPSPEQAAEALAAAWHGGQTADLLKIFGPEGEKLVSSGDPVAEKRVRAKLSSSYDKWHRIENDGKDKAIIVMGEDRWPYPIPLVKQEARWRFDVAAGAQEIIDRRVGRNELNAIQLCRAFVEAQREFAAKDRLGNGHHEFAQKIASGEGQHDGLYGHLSDGDQESAFEALVAEAEAGGYGVLDAEGKAPLKGYYFRILTEQGQNADGGAKKYLADGHMTGGFALVAFPSGYLSSGIMTFMVNQDGIVFQKNLGAETKDVAERMTAYDPDQTWSIVER
jgi:hypothetical protein